MTRAGQPPLADYGVIGDGRSVALIARGGSIDWWCVPGPASDAVFARILDTRLGGCFDIHPMGAHRAERRYLPHTPMLETTFVTEDGAVARMRDFMPALTEAQKRTHPIAFRGIHRRIRVERGGVTLRVELRARPEFGRKTPRLRRIKPLTYAIQWADQALHLASTHALEMEDGTLTGMIPLTQGDRLDLALVYSPESPADLPMLAHADHLERLTHEYWQDWTSRSTYSGPYRDAVLRSAITLKLLAYAPSGAIIAAPTTSLPETLGGERNWDYRYCWLRDAAFTVRALLEVGHRHEAHAFAEWMLHATRLTHPRMKIMYTVYGGPRIPERAANWLDGYRDSRPVRIGNGAAKQFQLDVYGDVIEALALYQRSDGRFDRDGKRMLRGMAKFVMKHWNEPDQGIWEVRSGRAQHTHSKAMAWLALDRLVELDRALGLGLDAGAMQAAADAIRDWVLTHGYDAGQRAFIRAPDDRGMDAALLMLPIVGFLDANDPRLAGTVDAIQRSLARDDLVYRYLGSDGLPSGEGAFVICSFWMVQALARIGRVDEATRWFEKLLARPNDLGLLSEEIDPDTGEFLGNMPQGFSHIGLINAALMLEQVSR